MWKMTFAAAAMSLMAHAPSAQAAHMSASPPLLRGTLIEGAPEHQPEHNRLVIGEAAPDPVTQLSSGPSFDLTQALVDRELADRETLERSRFGIVHASFDALRQKPAGPNFDITGQLLGALQYHWTAGQKPELGVRGVPARLKIKRDGLYVGFSYRP
jgi:hypothetical protein